MNRGDVWWARFAPPDRTRPVVLVSREESIARRELVTVAMVTTHRRAIRSQVALGADEGLPRPSVANCDDLRTIRKSRLLGQAGTLGSSKIADLDAALTFALGLD